MRAHTADRRAAVGLSRKKPSDIIRIAMMFSDRPSGEGSGVPPSRPVHGSRTACGVSVLLLVPVVLAVAGQAPRRPGQHSQVSEPLQLATRALLEGRYAEVDQLVSRLDAHDPNVAALKARADVARGQYEHAEQMLKPVAGRAPASEAALELGLLEQQLD